MLLKTAAAVAAATLVLPLLSDAAIVESRHVATCDSVTDGYQCSTNISHHWGQYSPYFAVPSSIPNSIPLGCQVTFVSVLSRHGARDPTAGKTVTYRNLISKIHAGARSYGAGYDFIRTYNYTLGADQLTTFGQQEMVNSGIKFYQRYAPLTSLLTPFFRSSGETRVFVSAQNFTQGFHQARLDATRVDPATYPYPIVVIAEAPTSNNTLNHETCSNFENGPDSQIAGSAQRQWSSIFVPPIQQRVNNNLPGASLTASDIISLMDLCPFNTVASDSGAVSQFCGLFTEQEWNQYGYYQSLNKWYGYGPGNPLGPTQGAGWVTELVSRMTGDRRYVQAPGSYTSINHTLDDDPTTFPLGRSVPLYADFSHDNDITAAISNLGLYNSTQQLSNITLQTEQETNGYSAAYTVPFGARVYAEKMLCPGRVEELVRVLVNDRVTPLQNCGADALGRCTLSRFVASQSFASTGAKWSQCYS